MAKPGDWMKDPTFLANAGHTLAGYGWMLTTAFFSLACSHAWIVMLVSWIVLLALVVFKEYVIDLREESDETVGSSTIDAIGWLAGSVIAWGDVLLSHFVFGRWP